MLPLINEIPSIISKEMVQDLYSLSKILSFAESDTIFLNKIMKKKELNKDLFVENNINKTLSNIDTDFNKEEFTGKEIKSIISDYKINQYNTTLLKLFKEISELCYIQQSNKEDDKLIDTVDIFVIIYISKYIEDLSEKILNEKSMFYEIPKFDSIFADSTPDNQNPFLNFLKNIPNIKVKTETLIDKQSIDNLFYID